jgi:hypothetical protein
LARASASANVPEAERLTSREARAKALLRRRICSLLGGVKSANFMVARRRPEARRGYFIFGIHYLFPTIHYFFFIIFFI